MDAFDLLARQQMVLQLTDRLAVLGKEAERIGEGSAAGDFVSSQMGVILSVIEFLSHSGVREKNNASSFRCGFDTGVREAKKAIASRLSRCYDSGASQVVLAVEVAPAGLEVNNG